MEGFNRVHDSRMEISVTLLQQAAVSDLVRERVLEGVFEIRKEARLVKELGGLEVAEPPSQVFLCKLGNLEQESERHVFADDRGRLEQPLVLWRQAVDAGRQNRLHRRRHLNRLSVLRQP